MRAQAHQGLSGGDPSGGPGCPSSGKLLLPRLLHGSGKIRWDPHKRQKGLTKSRRIAAEVVKAVVQAVK